MRVPGHHYATTAKGKLRPYAVVRVETVTPARRGASYGLRYTTVRRLFTLRGAIRVADRLNAQEAS